MYVVGMLWSSGLNVSVNVLWAGCYLVCMYDVYYV